MKTRWLYVWRVMLRSRFARHIRSICRLSFVAAFAAGPVVAAPAKPPLELADQGYFYAGGHYQPDADGDRTVDQMFVQYEVPLVVKYPYPIIMIHGTDQDGTNYLGVRRI
jgi:hypothetical protein